ncbi:xylulokinase [Nakamurella sp. UYEF19]|uniref:FGGY-family carbohydrate kinase n=1 Tax=Nakamurella sp. UYEF19 TaxID=1756392 RepID=UPI0033951ABE
MTAAAVLGVDIGSSSSKGVLVSLDGAVLAQVQRDHDLDRPVPGHVEMDAQIWWAEFTSMTAELLARHPIEVIAVGVSGMGPCVLLVDDDDVPVRPAILYGVDTRALDEITGLTDDFGEAAIVARCGSALSTQAVGPKLAWLARHEPADFARARRLFMPSSWLVRRLTGRYVLDHHSASQSTPLYDAGAARWFEPWWQQICPQLRAPELLWSDQVGGRISAAAAAATGLPAGIPVIAGTIDAWAEAVSVGALGIGDLMLMYGSTMFLINTVDRPVSAPPLWATVGVTQGSRNLAAGMATSGSITAWLRELFGRVDYAHLLSEAGRSPAGANGLLMLPYFAGERTPIADPMARGLIAGLTLSHTRGDLYRAALEATAMGVRHNVDVMAAAGGRIDRAVAVGGGTQGGLWAQIVCDVTGLPQELRETSVGASYGAAFLAAGAVVDPTIDHWNPVASVIRPNAEMRPGYDDLYHLYTEARGATLELGHSLSRRQIETAAARRTSDPRGVHV